MPTEGRPEAHAKTSGKILKAIWRWSFCAWWRTRPLSRLAPWGKATVR